MQKFNKISTYSNIIKNLLATTYLPLVRTVREGDYLCVNRLYVFKSDIIKCTSSGYIDKGRYLDRTPLATWTRIGDFKFGDKNGKLSTNYVSNAEGYDYKTHERFGQYLRNLRDMYGLNLLPLYNCFSNQFLENHIIKNNRVIKTIENNNTKIYKIPIRFNQDYTLCIENVGVTTVAPAFIRYNSLLKQNNTRYGNGVDMTNQYISLHYADNIHNYVNLSFGRPVKIRFNNVPEYKQVNLLNSYYNDNDELYYNNIKSQYLIDNELCSHFADVEDHLYLLIQVPKVFNQNIVVLEGDYTSIESQKIIETQFMDIIPDFLYDKYYTHDLNLMTGTSTEPRPFSPVLIEFILWNALCTLDTINNDFDRLTIDLSTLYLPNTDDIWGRLPNYWVSRYRQIISDYINNETTNTVQDNIGYVTRDIEEYINSHKNITNIIGG